MHRDDVVRFLDDLLKPGSIPDFQPQGLQVEGRAEVRKVACGVSVSAELLRRAADWGADLVICHHGLFWDSDSPVVRGGHRDRLRLLIENEMTLLGYHMVLDAHDDHGNNAILSRELGLTAVEPFAMYQGAAIGRKGRFDPPLSQEAFLTRVREKVGGDPLVFPFGPDPVRSVGLVTGSAPDDLNTAIAEGLDAFLTGEVREWVQEVARESGITYVTAGHYRTETFGVRSLGDLLREELGLETRFVDVPNPV